MQLPANTKLGGQYRIVEVLSSSHQSAVHLAFDEMDNQMVAIKVISRDADERGAFASRFRKEARILNELHSPLIVRVLAFDVQDKFLYLVTEFVPGKTINQLLKEKGPFDDVDCLRIGSQVAEALTLTSEKGIVHRDIKPSNIMVTPTGRIKLLDFGMALDVSKLTSHEALGTLAYLSPEQTDPGNKSLDVRSDIYSLGTTMYEMLTGQVPFRGQSLLQLARAILMDRPVSMRNYRDGIMEETEALVMHCLEKRPDDRYANPQSLAEAIRHVIGLVETRNRPQTMLLKAQAAFQNQDWRGVIALCDDILKKFPAYGDARTLRLQAETRQKEERRKGIERMLELAEQAFGARQWDTAIERCDQVLGMEPGNARAEELRAEARKRKSNWPVLVGSDGAKYILSKGRNVIGRPERAPGATPPDIDLSGDPYGKTVSRRHAQIVRDGDGWRLQLDEKVLNRTLVNEEVVEPGARRPIHNGDKLRLGGVVLTFLTDDDV